jgi:asparagine synthase (glutamine-hydrolysing)
MCGIAGWVDWERDLGSEAATVERMREALRHRGPDAAGTWTSTRAILAHRRLIVLDPEGGAQPMTYDDGRTIVITFNGEIYNFQELRRELEARGHVFRTRSDTEVLLHAYAAWGEAFVARLNGIFAFALWDAAAQRLLLARDHLGVKPLFYAQRGSAVLFGSELKALLAHPLVEPEIDDDGLGHIFGPGPVHPPGFGLFRDVHEVRPGHYLVFERGKERVERYWALESRPHTDDLDTTVERIRALLEDTVRRQLVADVPVVTLLSGGLDSSGVTALAARERRAEGKGLDSYSIDFAESARYFTPTPMHLSLDTPWALRVSEHTGTRQHTIVVDAPALVSNLLETTRAYDAPGLGQMDTSMYLLFKAMKRDATVALSGESADEVFGGYPWFFHEAAVAGDTFPWLTLIRGRNDRAQALLSPELVERVRPEAYVARRYAEALAEVPRLEGEVGIAARRRELFYLNITRWLPVLLDRKDRMSMATGFEVRVPFCDHRLVEYVWNIPWEMKMVDGIEKGVLRRAFADVLPDDVRARRKSPYPSVQHPDYVRGIRERVLQLLDEPAAPVWAFLRAPAVRALCDVFGGDARDAWELRPLEQLLEIDFWLRTYRVRVR